jgi:hypothetical protein
MLFFSGSVLLFDKYIQFLIQDIGEGTHTGNRGAMDHYYDVYSITVRDGARVHYLRVGGNSPLLNAIDLVVEGETEIRYITDSGTQLILQADDTHSFLLMSLDDDNWVTVTSRQHARTATSEEQESDSTGADDFMGSGSEEDQENFV